MSGGSGRRGETPGRRRKRGERCGGGAWFATGRRGVRAPYCGRRGDGARRPAAERAGPIHSENRQQGRRAVRQAIGAGVCNSETARREATGPERPSTAPPYPALRSTRALRCSRKRSEHSGRPKRPPSNAMKHPPPPPGAAPPPPGATPTPPRQVGAHFTTFYAVDQSGDVGAITLTWRNISDRVSLGTDQGRYLRKP